MATPDVLTETLLEATTGFYTFTLNQDSAFLTSLTLTLVDRDSNQIVNGRDHQNILNANGGTVVTESTLAGAVTTVTVELVPADTVVLNQGRVRETRILQFVWTWDSGQRAAAHAVAFAVDNLVG